MARPPFTPTPLTDEQKVTVEAIIREAPVNGCQDGLFAHAEWHAHSAMDDAYGTIHFCLYDLTPDDLAWALKVSRTALLASGRYDPAPHFTTQN